MACLFKLFLGPGDNFWKSYDENRSAIHAYNIAGDLRHAGDPSHAIDDFKNYAGDVHNFLKKYPQDLTLVYKDAAIVYNLR